MTLNVPNEVLTAISKSEQEFLIDFAAFLYEKQIYSMGQARKVAGLDLISFQKELAKRNVYLHYGIEDLATDLETIAKMKI